MLVLINEKHDEKNLHSFEKRYQ